MEEQEKGPDPQEEEEEEEEEGEAGRLALRFQRGFLSAQRLPCFPWADLEKKLKTSKDSSLLLTILQETVLHPLCLKYPPSVKYRRCFLSELIKKHEATGAEPLDQIYESLADVLNAEESANFYKSYLLPSEEAITLGESMAIISQGTTGLVTWDAGLYLAEWALENPALFTNRSILELGSGIGLTGLAICKACHPSKYTFSDHHPCVLQKLLENIRLNGFAPESDICSCSPAKLDTQKAELAGFEGPQISVTELDWSLVTKEELAGLSSDVVIAADVVYDPELMHSLIRVLQKLPSGLDGKKAPEVYIAFTVRNPDTYHCFQTELDKVGIKWQAVPCLQKNMFPYDPHAKITLLRLFI
ncbi:protein-lysine N-methyltransferase EEF2KMT [Anolis carolinensis]|uniref:protein-lysine N-methyltransferase EEF2KMT n=1 Tax=Anolis carolinensis TaxID=28377 RepID=UPI002F2B4775